MTIPGARKNWVAPLEFAADPRFLFGASENVYRIDTEPADATARAWVQISGDLTDGPELPRAPGFGTITALGTSETDPNLALRRHRQRPDVGKPERDGRGCRGHVDGAREPALPRPLGHADHGRPGQREDRVGDLLGLAER